MTLHITLTGVLAFVGVSIPALYILRIVLGYLFIWLFSRMMR